MGAVDKGFRRAQLGATWALASRVLSREPLSLAILPTGVGKTAVVTAVPIAVASLRTLVIVPSKIVRRQVGREFGSLKTLRHVGAFPRKVGHPKTKTVRHRVRSLEQWAEFSSYDVVIATPHCVSPSYSDVSPPPENFFDLVIIDEAHHLPASTWSAIIGCFERVPIVMLTATPYRRDGRTIPGDIVYWYPLNQAIADGVYSPISYVPINPVQGEARDVTLAKAARRRIESATHRRLRSQLVVRTDAISDAHRLRAIYREEGLGLAVLTSDLPQKQTDDILRDLDSGSIQGAIVVGILTEGFDLPRLKIAVYHHKHQSFAATLQFVGRLARTIDGRVMQAELLAFADDVSIETASLYREDASWPELLPKIADAAVQRERKKRGYAESFVGKPTEFSLNAIAARKLVEVFELSDLARLTLRASFRKIAGGNVIETFSDPSDQVRAIVTEHRARPEWLESPVYDSYEYRLHLIVVDRALGLLYVSTETEGARDEILLGINASAATPVAPDRINSALHTYPVIKYPSAGFRNRSASAVGGTSYKTLAGASVAGSVLPSDESSSTVGHVFAQYLENGESRIIGMAMDGSKIWESRRASLLDFKDWCSDLSRRLSSPVQANTPPGLRVSVARKIVSFPRDALAMTLAPELYASPLNLIVGGARIPIADVGLRVRSANNRLLTGFAHGGRLVSVQIWDCGGGSVSRRDVMATFGNDTCSLYDLLKKFPPQVFFADGSSVSGHSFMPPPAILTPIPSEALRKVSWKGVDIRSESKPARANFAHNIISKVANDFASDARNQFVLIDDAANEIADIIAMSSLSPGQASVDLIHCKWSSEDQPGARLEDLYQLICQVNKCVRWTNPSTFYAEVLRRVMERGSTSVVKGGIPELQAWLAASNQRPPTTLFRMFAVQPGLNITRIAKWSQGWALLLSCYQWCLDRGFDLIVWGS